MATNKRLIKSNDEAIVGGDFNTVLYTGNGTSQTITGVGFDPDMVWVKRRDASANSHILQDTIRGGGQANTLIPDRTDAQGVNGQYGYISSFGTDSFGVAAGTTSAEHTNFLNASYVAWCWKAGGAAVTNTDGTITSQVSANTEAGFSIVSYTGVGAGSNRLVGHGLGQAPKIIIVKNRTVTKPWLVWTTIIDGSMDYLFLNSTGGSDNAGQSLPTSTVFNIQNDGGGESNSNGNNYIAYCFAEVAGFSKFGSYVGNGTASLSNPIIDCGFEPAFVMIKNASSSGTGWFMFDNKRNPTNPANRFLQAQSSGAEGVGGLSTDYLQFESNGFRSTSDSPSLNGSGNTLIFMAFANQF